LIPASGWYEFPEVSRGKKQPVYFTPPDKQPFCFAGIWEHWARPVGEHEEITSMAILTCEPNATVARYHDRMPVMVAPEHYQAWLDPESDLDAAYQLLHPSSQTLPLDVWPVTPRVGNVRYQAEDCTTPITPELVKSEPPKPQQLDLF
jgi:putative SOS response-associated peptidase YedK